MNSQARIYPSKSTLVSVDPGLTTGVAIFDRTGELVITASFNCNSDTKISILVEFLKLWKNSILVMERPPQGGDYNLNRRIVDRIWVEFDDVELIYPGLWKPSMKTRKTKVSSRHEEDAVNMGIYFQQHRMGR